MNDLTEIKKIIVKKPLKLDCGKEISNFPWLTKPMEN